MVDEVNVDLSTICIDGITVERRGSVIVVVLFNVREVSFLEVNSLPVRNIVVFVLS
jgi:hypothetical protein